MLTRVQNINFTNYSNNPNISDKIKENKNFSSQSIYNQLPVDSLSFKGSGMPKIPDADLKELRTLVFELIDNLDNLNGKHPINVHFPFKYVPDSTTSKITNFNSISINQIEGKGLEIMIEKYSGKYDYTIPLHSWTNSRDYYERELKVFEYRLLTKPIPYENEHLGIAGLLKEHLPKLIEQANKVEPQEQKYFQIFEK